MKMSRNAHHATTTDCLAPLAALPRTEHVEEVGDHRLALTYGGTHFRVEVRSVAMAAARPRRDGALLMKYECHAGRRRTVRFDDGSEVETTSYSVDDFDVIAVELPSGMFALARALDMPRLEATGRNLNKYTRHQLEHLIKRTVPLHIVNGVPKGPYTLNPSMLLDSLID